MNHFLGAYAHRTYPRMSLFYALPQKHSSTHAQKAWFGWVLEPEMGCHDIAASVSLPTVWADEGFQNGLFFTSVIRVTVGVDAEITVGVTG